VGTDRWRLLVVGYLLWVIAFTVVEGAGRQACRMPTARWVAGATDPRERAMRASFRDQATFCLEGLAWHVYSMRALVLCALAAPVALVWLVRRRSELVRSMSFVTGLGLMLGSIVAIRWIYDWLG
jgi:hypothetical protein